MSDLRQKRGFTLMEIMVAIAIIGVLVGVAIPFYLSMVEIAKEKICIAKQRTIFQAAIMYDINEPAPLKDAGGRKERCAALIEKGYIKNQSAFECPSSGYLDYDDYDFIYDGDELTDIRCQVEPTKHKWP